MDVRLVDADADRFAVTRGREIGDELPGQPLVLEKDHVLLRQNDSASGYPRPSQTVHFYPRG